MKFLCEWCERLADATRFRLEGAELVVTCARCGADTRARSAEPPTEIAAGAAPTPVSAPAVVPAPPPVPAPAPAPSTARVVPLHAVPPPTFGDEDPFSVPADRCPKCVAPRPEGTLSCTQCGLVYANFVAAEHQPSPEVQVAWMDLVAHWDDLAAHDRALAASNARGDLAEMGRLYRIRLARQPRDPIASRGRDEVLKLAANASALWSARVARGNPERGKQSLTVVAAVMLGASLLFLAWMILFRF